MKKPFEQRFWERAIKARLAAMPSLTVPGTDSSLAAEFGITSYMVYAIRTGLAWRHIAPLTAQPVVPVEVGV